MPKPILWVELHNRFYNQEQVRWWQYFLQPMNLCQILPISTYTLRSSVTSYQNLFSPRILKHGATALGTAETATSRNDCRKWKYSSKIMKENKKISLVIHSPTSAFQEPPSTHKHLLFSFHLEMITKTKLWRFLQISISCFTSHLCSLRSLLLTVGFLSQELDLTAFYFSSYSSSWRVKYF